MADIGPSSGFAMACTSMTGRSRFTEGVAAADLSDTQRRLLASVASTYVGWTRDGHNETYRHTRPERSLTAYDHSPPGTHHLAEQPVRRRDVGIGEQP